mgnify:CR=1 FL=1
MKKVRFDHIVLCVVAFALAACSSSNGGSEDIPDVPTTPEETKLPINISTTIGNLDVDTRATDYAFEQGDKIGLYVVNHAADGTSQPLQPTGNHVDNMLLTYNGMWIPRQPIYWQDKTTNADFYLYSPYRATIDDVKAMPFSVAADQSREADYKAGDLLIGSAKNIAPTEEAVSVATKHVMSQMLVKLVPGNGFTEQSLASADVKIQINGLKTEATVNIAEAKATVAGTAKTITPLKQNDEYRAVVVPQTVAEGNLITVTVDGRDFNLKKGFTFVAGTRHKFTVTLYKVSNGVNVTIDKWENDDIDHGGIAE